MEHACKSMLCQQIKSEAYRGNLNLIRTNFLLVKQVQQDATIAFLFSAMALL